MCIRDSDTLNCEDWVCDIDSLIAWGVVSADDSCSAADLEVTCLPQSYDCVGSYILDYTATDSCGLTSTFQQIILLEDDTPPTVNLTCPGDVTLAVDDDCYVNTDTTSLGAGSAMATFDDNCELDSDTLYYSDAVTDSTSTGCYTIERTWTATAVDACNQTTTETCTQTIVIEDNIDPTVTLTCPADKTVYVDGD